MKARVLPILNAIGCLVLTGVVTAQWFRERNSDQKLVEVRNHLAAAMDFSAGETKRAAALERDIAVLKESIEATQKSAEEAARAAAETATQASGFETEITAAREQVKTWEAAIAERDAKLKDLNSELVTTRRRLDEAIVKLKAAGAR